MHRSVIPDQIHRIAADTRGGMHVHVLRTIAERLSRDFVVKRRLPRQFGKGPILVSSSGGLKYLVRPMVSIDPMLLRAAETWIQANDCVWDIGANVGLFTFAAAARAGRTGQVIALEADTWCVQLLRRSARLCRERAPVTVISAAVAQSYGLRQFLVADRARASNALQGYGLSQMGGIAEVQTVVSVSLDWLFRLLPPPDFLKVDVEGAEAEVLRGGKALFEERRPTVLCEVARENIAEVSDFFLSRRYDLFDAELPNGSTRLREATMNTLCVPATIGM